MKRRRKTILSLALAAVLAMSMTVCAFAADIYTEPGPVQWEPEMIGSITLSVNSSITAGDDNCDVDVSVTSGNCSVNDVEVQNAPDGDWKAGAQPRVMVQIEADDGYAFDNINSHKIQVRNNRASVISVNNSDGSDDGNDEIQVILRLASLNGSYDIDDAYWRDDSSAYAEWDDDAGSERYQVQLYHDDNAVGNAVTTDSRHYNFASMINHTGRYSFRVRVYYNSNKKGDWVVCDDDLEVDQDMLERFQRDRDDDSGNSGSGNGHTVIIEDGNGNTTTYTTGNAQAGQWVRAADGVRWWYRYNNGGYPSNGWEQIGGKWYCFDSQGYMRTGWIKGSDGNWYYCDATSGAMLTNAWTPDGYYVDSNGVWEQNTPQVSSTPSVQGSPNAAVGSSGGPGFD